MHRVHVEKKPAFTHEARHLLGDLRESLQLPNLETLRLVQRYDLDGLSDEQFAAATRLILSEPQTDTVSPDLHPGENEHAFAVEYLPGQFDQRADSAAQCIQILTGGERPFVASARVHILRGDLSPEDLRRIKSYVINAVDSHEVPLDANPVRQAPATPPNVEILTDFNTADPADLRAELGLAMSEADIAHCQRYFSSDESRPPSITEIRMLDTYWSDHCRHTTFLTKIDEVSFDEGTEPIQRAWQTYQQVRANLDRTEKPVTLMDIALLGMRELRASGELDNLEVSEEINAASIVVPISRHLDIQTACLQLPGDEAFTALPENLARQAREFLEAADDARGIPADDPGGSGSESPLASRARKRGRLIQSDRFAALGSPDSNATSEHEVWLGSEDEQRVWKRTWPGFYGQIPDRDGPGRLIKVNATASEYLVRMALHVVHFRSDIRLLGVTISDSPGMIIGRPAGEPSLAISQELIVPSNLRAPHPGWAEIRDFMRSHGFEEVSGGFYAWSRADGLTAIDAKPDNFILTEEGVVPIDLQLAFLPPTEEWLIQFKNETHNHPTEIEPFGGAATCLGGCIRDPLSGRSYVYQAMRVTGAADPRTPFSETLPGKLPQKKICQTAARGYSSYGNQIGLATGQVAEIYHPGYLAKRLEIGAVVAAAPRTNVFRGTPASGDLILLIGGRTGRDGVGGATGSSKEHTDTALENSAEVQKGDAPTERKIQRLFRNPELSRKIKICNDFGAGGVSVAIGEIAPSLDIDLDAVPKKYDGLDGTELAISESQERMAVCIDPADRDFFIAASDAENLECVQVATVRDHGRLRMTWRGKRIVDLSRAFLDTNGVQQTAAVHVTAIPPAPPALTAGLSSLHEQSPSLLERSASPGFRESLGPVGETIANVLRRVHRAGEKAGAPPPGDRQSRLDFERALRSVEERELRRLTAVFLPSENLAQRWTDAGCLGGAEQKVTPTADGKEFTKVNNGSYHGHWLQYLERLHWHRLLFPETAYRIDGLTEDDLAIGFVVTQTTARACQDPDGNPIGATRAAVEAEMAARFGARRFRNDDYYLPALDLFVEDLHDENVLVGEDGETLLFIDPVIFRRPADMPAPFPASTSSSTDHCSLITDHLSKLNHASQKGLGEMFDGSVGAGTVLWPFGGERQLTPPDAMVAKLPLLEGDTDACTFMAWAFNPETSSASPFHGAAHAVTESVCKAVAAGARLTDIRLTLQEYFPKLGDDPARWGQPFAALLGAFDAQHQLRLAAIGGKDSMSGSFNELDVPPTLVSFALAPGNAGLALSPEFKRPGATVSLVDISPTAEHLPDYERIKQVAAELHTLNSAGKLISVKSIGSGGLAHALPVCCFGNHLGLQATAAVTDLLFTPHPFSFLIEHADPLPKSLDPLEIGHVTDQPALVIGSETLPLDELLEAWTAPLEPIYPTKTQTEACDLKIEDLPSKHTAFRSSPISNTQSPIPIPRVLIPCFPGTNSEYDSAKAFREAGADAHVEVFRNLTPSHLEASLTSLAEKIIQSQILFLPGGFSAGDEPDGSAKFIATVLRHPRVADAVMDLIKNRNGLVLGICNGFQALIKTGLVPYGEIRDADPDAPTLFHNEIGRHISCYAPTVVTSNLSPWLANCRVGEVHQIPFSHGEGRFVASPEVIGSLAASGQIATRYCDPRGTASMEIARNPNGSAAAIEGLTSPCGRVFGKMGHSERRGTYVARNIPGEKHQPIFSAGVAWFS